jgi:hypothetical protein
MNEDSSIILPDDGQPGSVAKLERYRATTGSFLVDTHFVSENGIRIDNSKRKTATACMRKAYFDHYRGLKGQYGSTALRFGNVYHEAQRGYYQGVIDFGWDDQPKLMQLGVESAKSQWDKLTAEALFYPDYRTFENCMELFVGYLATYVDDRMYTEIIKTEQAFEVEFTLTEQELEMIWKMYKLVLPPITATGKIDLQLKIRQVPWILDFKTTSMSISQISQSLSKSMQYLNYTWASDKVLGYRPEGCLTSIAFASARKNKNGDYGSLSTDYQRIPVIYTEFDIAQWRNAYIIKIAELYAAYMSGNWPVDYDSCYLWNKQCPYMPLCMQQTDLESLNTDQYRVEFWDVLEEAE